MTARDRLRRRVTAGALVGVLALSACGSSPEIARDVSTAFHGEVVAVAQAAAEGRLAEASAGLARLRAALDAAAEGGDVSAARYLTIDDALTRTEAEVATLQAAQAAAEQAAAEQAAAEAAAAQAAAEQAAAEQAAAEQAAARQAAADQGGGGQGKDDEDKDTGRPDDPGKGNGKDD